ncbi:MAG: hypothetical protein ABJC66_03460 [Gammaproteobacteria bacterium]
MNNLQFAGSMPSHKVIAALCVAILALSVGGLSAAQEPESPLIIRSIAEIESRSIDAGRAVVKLIPADRVAPGDRVIYTLEVRTAGGTGVDAPSVTYAVPDHMKYIAESAVGPGADVSYSVDGGHNFDRADNLRVPGRDGRPRPATASDYTHIRWRLKNPLKADSVAFVRFRAMVN